MLYCQTEWGYYERETGGENPYTERIPKCKLMLYFQSLPIQPQFFLLNHISVI